MNQKREKTTIAVLFLLYIALMLYLLFFYRIHHGTAWLSAEAQEQGYWQTVRNHTNLKPFETVALFARHFRHTRQIFGFSFINLAGNVILFVPFGLFLPHYFQPLQKPHHFIKIMSLLIIAVEVTQIATLTGTCDIDDFILNTAGGCIGFLLFHMIHLLKERNFYGNTRPEYSEN
ncbi:MAG: VanZ family protein [Oscillospiraceae bacterium]